MSNTNSSFTVLAMISVAMHVSIVIFVVMAFFLAKQNDWTMTFILRDEHRILYFALGLVACMDAMICIFVPLFAKKREESDDLQTQINSQNYYQESSGQNRNVLFLDYKNVDEKVHKMTILRLAMAEAVAIFGFVLAIVSESPFMIIPFAVVGLALQIIFGPFVGRILSSS